MLLPLYYTTPYHLLSFLHVCIFVKRKLIRIKFKLKIHSLLIAFGFTYNLIVPCPLVDHQHSHFSAWEGGRPLESSSLIEVKREIRHWHATIVLKPNSSQLTYTLWRVIGLGGNGKQPPSTTRSHLVLAHNERWPAMFELKTYHHN